jgi:hypothetical protein
MDIVVILMKMMYSRLLPEDQLKMNLTKQSYEAGLTQIKSKLILTKFHLKKNIPILLNSIGIFFKKMNIKKSSIYTILTTK